MIDHRPMPETDPPAPARETGVAESPTDTAVPPAPPAGESPLPDNLFDRLDNWVERYIKDQPEARAGL